MNDVKSTGMRLLEELFGSKKFRAFVVAIVLLVGSEYGIEIDEDTLTNIVYVTCAYMGGQGLADFMKEFRSK